MNLIDCKVIHMTLGTGNVIAQDDSYVTVTFANKTCKFVYPDVFTSFLTFENPTVQMAIQKEITDAKEAAEAKEHAEKVDKQRAEEQRLAEVAAKRATITTSAYKKVASEQTRIPGKRMTFFVFQGTTYDRESRGGYIWAPISNKAGNTFHHWDRLLDVFPGDIILHGYDGYVQAVSTAISACYNCNQPVELSSEELWDKEGRRVDCDYIKIRNPVKTADFVEDIIRLCNVKYAPFDKYGSGNMGYLFEINRDLAQIFLRASVSLNPQLGEIDYIKDLLSEAYHG